MKTQKKQKRPGISTPAVDFNSGQQVGNPLKQLLADTQGLLAAFEGFCTCLG